MSEALTTCRDSLSWLEVTCLRWVTLKAGPAAFAFPSTAEGLGSAGAARSLSEDALLSWDFVPASRHGTWNFQDLVIDPKGPRLVLWVTLGLEVHLLLGLTLLPLHISLQLLERVFLFS